MGRPKDKRKEFAKFVMSEGEDEAFIEYFRGWKTNRKLSETEKPEKGSVKNIDSSIGRYSNKFLALRWVNKKKTLFRYTYEKKWKELNKDGKTIEKGRTVKQKQWVPCYKADITPFIDYFLKNANNYQLPTLNKEAMSALYIFFELKEVRDYMLSLYPYYRNHRFGLYECFLRALEDKLIYDWLCYEGKFHSQLKLFIELENKMLTDIPDFANINKEALNYLKDNESNYERLPQRERVVESYDSAWKAFIKTSGFKVLLDLKKNIANLKIRQDYSAQSKIYLSSGLNIDIATRWQLNDSRDSASTKKHIASDLKIGYFARILYSKAVADAIIESFLSPLTKELIFSTKSADIIPAVS